MILSFIAQNRIHFKTRKYPGFPGFLFSATRNPGFKILPRIGNTACTLAYAVYENNEKLLSRDAAQVCVVRCLHVANISTSFPKENQ